MSRTHHHPWFVVVIATMMMMPILSGAHASSLSSSMDRDDGVAAKTTTTTRERWMDSDSDSVVDASTRWISTDEEQRTDPPYPPYPPYPSYPCAPDPPTPPHPPRPPPAPHPPHPPHPPRAPPNPERPPSPESPPKGTESGVDAVALMIFSALSVAFAVGACYVVMWYGGEEEGNGGGGGRRCEGVGGARRPPRVSREMNLKEELVDFADYARKEIASGAKSAIVRVQRLTHRDEGEEGDDESWRRLSDTNPFVRWLKRQLRDEDDDVEALGESLIDEDDDDYGDLLAEPYSEFTDYFESANAAPENFEDVEDASFVRLPARNRSKNPEWLASGDDDAN